MSERLDLFVRDMVERVEAIASQPLPDLGSESAIYRRISDDPEGRAEGIERQEEDTLKRAADDGVIVPPEAIFTDNDLSASTASKKPRPDFERLLAYVLQGKVKRIYAYSNSRLTRRPMEFEVLILMHRQYGVDFRTCVSGSDDLSTADGRMVARFKAAADAGESERTSERVTRTIKQRRDRGESSLGGIRPFGYKQEDRTQVEPVEAEAIRSGARTLLTGGTTGDVLRAWEDAGIKPVKAAKWSRRTIIGIYRAPRIAGLYQHDGALMESKNVPAILSRSEWEAVNEILAPDDSWDATKWRRRNLLSDVLRCGNCGHRMNSKGPHYGCLTQYGGCGSNFRKRDWLDALLDDLMVARLSTIPTGTDKDDSPVVDHSAEIQRLEGLIEKTKEALTLGQLDAGDAFPMISGYRDRVTALRKEEAAHVKTEAQKVKPEDALTLWRSGDLDARRRILRDEVQMIIVHKIGRGYGQHKPLPVEAIDVVWT